MGTLALEGYGGSASAEVADARVPDRSKYEPGLDGLRALALAAVVVFHGIGGPEGGQHIGRGGFLGVDVFFVLSGYLITTLLLRERAAEGRLDLRSFWLRRAARLLPALVLMLAIVVAYAHLGAPGAASIRGGVVPTLLYYQNWHLIGRPFSLESHTWSLSIEEQWYLVWPIVLGIALWRTRRPSRGLLLFVGALTVASVYWTAHIYEPLSGRSYLETETRAQSLLLGAGLAIAFALYGRPRTKRSARVLDAAAMASLLVLVWAFATWREEASYVYHGGLLLVAAASGVMIVAATHPESWIRRALSVRVLVAVGVISYGAYLYNPIADAILDHQRTHLSPYVLFWVQVVVTLGFAYVSWRLIERPFRHTGPQRLWPWLVLAAVVVGVLIGTFTINPGAKAKSSLTFADIARGYSNLARSAPPGATRVLLTGGSEANAVAAGSAYRNDHVLGVASASPGCGLIARAAAGSPPTHVQYVRCAFAPGVTAHVADAFGPAVVVVSVEDADLGAEAGSSSWTSTAVSNLAGFRRMLPPTVTHVVVVDLCSSESSVRGQHAQADRALAAYARQHPHDLTVAVAPPAVCPDGVSPIAAWRWLERVATPA